MSLVGRPKKGSPQFTKQIGAYWAVDDPARPDLVLSIAGWKLDLGFAATLRDVVDAVAQGATRCDRN